MKSTGIVRKVDELGRIVLPVEMRRILDIEYKDSLEISMEGSTILIKKYQSACVFCGSTKSLAPFKDKFICKKCKAEIAEKDI